MNKTDVIRAWKDPMYRATLSEEEQAALPLNPAGIADLSDDQLRIAGGASVVTTAPTCTNDIFLNWRACCPITTAVTIAAEHRDLSEGDIPFFSTLPSSHDLWTSRGETAGSAAPAAASNPPA